jgi:hypothetical protein
MTIPHVRAAKAENARDSGGMGRTTEVEVFAGEGKARGIRDATTREQTYSTI